MIYVIKYFSPNKYYLKYLLLCHFTSEKICFFCTYIFILAENSMIYCLTVETFLL